MPQRQQPRLEEQIVKTPQARVLRNRETIKRPRRYQEGIAQDTVFIALGDEPQNFEEAIHGLHANEWKRAMDEEMESLKRNKTWKIVNLEDAERTIENHWVFKLKRNPNGTIERYKARLVAKG